MLGRMLAREGVVEGAEETLGAERGVLVVVLMGAVRAWARADAVGAGAAGAAVASGGELVA